MEAVLPAVIHVRANRAVSVGSGSIPYRKEAGGPAPERHREHIVEHVDVLAEAVEHAADGRAVEEADGGRAQHAAQQRRVQRARRRQRAQVQRQRRHRHRHHCVPHTLLTHAALHPPTLSYPPPPPAGIV